MSTETFTTVINGNEYAYTQLSAKDSLLLKFRLAKVIGSSASILVGALGKNDEEQMEIFAEGITKVFEKNEPEFILGLIEKIFAPAFRGGERVNIDSHYQGEFSEMYSALFWVLKKEYGSFFKDAGELMKKEEGKTTPSTRQT